MNLTLRTTLALLALCAGALAAIAVSPEPTPAHDEISAVELAEWIRARRPGLRLLDTRSADAMQRDHLPGAQSAADVGLGALRADDTLVVYADRRVDEATVTALRRKWGPQRVLRLHGGVEAWNDAVLFPVIRSDAPARQQRQFVRRAQLSRYFGGAPRVLDPGAAADRRRSRRGC